MTIGLSHYLVLSAILFGVGLYGALARRSAIIILMCIEIMLNAANISLAAFSRFVTPTALSGQAFAIFNIVVAAAEVTVGLAIMISVFRYHDSIDTSKIDLMKW
jgi:NAD(P)H-quinone oxidoreductase subunit 4L